MDDIIADLMWDAAKHVYLQVDAMKSLVMCVPGAGTHLSDSMLSWFVLQFRKGGMGTFLSHSVYDISDGFKF